MTLVVGGCQEQDSRKLVFHTLSGNLYIERNGDWIEMDLTSYELNEIPVSEDMEKLAGVKPLKAYIDRDLLLVYEDEKTITEMDPDTEILERLPGLCVGVTARGKEYDCVSRFFAPKIKILEDPVTGSVHAMIVPYWAGVLGKDTIHAYQAGSFSVRTGEKGSWSQARLHCMQYRTLLLNCDASLLNRKKHVHQYELL
ncbi:MAG: PhzF family phenazine biosynthesis protein [Clostridia bacterium]|nr:PhzF family phenazine biosynthesis protein [Clostridia bacterium]